METIIGDNVSRIELIEQNDDLKIRIYRSHEIIEHKEEFIRQIESSRRSLRAIYPDIDSTWGYNVYNLFAISAGYELFYNLYQDLQTITREFLQTDEPLWMQSWANYQWENDVLDWHTHFDWKCHGYISIEPHDSITMFHGFDIVNEVGNIYIGPTDVPHKVYIKRPLDSPRITCGFDIADMPTLLDMQERDAVNISFMPI